MRWRNTSAGYGTLSVAFHWLMLILIAVAYVTMEFRSIFPKGSAGRAAMIDLHYIFGLLVFALVWLRLIARSFGATPAIDPLPPGWQVRLARVVHYALYALMILLPLSGWLLINAEGTQLSLFGVTLPALIGKSKRVADLLEEIHEFLATTGYFLIGLHAAAALFHHYIRRDNVFKLMSFRS